KPEDPGSPIYSVPPASYPKPWLGAQPAAVVTPGVNFFLEEVTPDQGGNYRCCYQKLDWGPGVWSHPSDALELLVTGESLGEGGVEKGH
ncbi:hypothetical protein E2I00_003290, partial [Balaenoptera physalus]